MQRFSLFKGTINHCDRKLRKQIRQRDCIKYNYRNDNDHLLIDINNVEYLFITKRYFKGNGQKTR